MTEVPSKRRLLQPVFTVDFGHKVENSGEMKQICNKRHPEGVGD